MKILVADPDPTTRDLVAAAAGSASDLILASRDADETLRLLAEHDDVDVLVAESRLPGAAPGHGVLTEVRAKCPQLQVILLAAFGTVEDAVEAMRAGAADFRSKPFTTDEIALAIDRAMDKARLLHENEELREALDDRVRIDNVVATDARMRDIFKTVKAVAPSRTTVLITGESGTGKTLLARALHGLSDRRHGPFVEVNCGALPESLLESELFGHVRGAFTGAVRDRQGKFEAASGGTIFLDEIGTSSPGFQVRLLRVLQDRVLERVGDTTTVPVDVRIVLATNIDLAAAVRDGTFREDLYYRIRVVELHMPSLRERRSDVPFLAEHFLHRLRHETGKDVTGFDADATERLMRWHWPGNVRELENVVERAVVLAQRRVLGVEDLPLELRLGQPRPAAAGVTVGSADDGHPTGSPYLDSSAADLPTRPLRDAVADYEREYLERALAYHDGNREATARALGINRSTLFHKLRKYDLR